MAFTLDPQIATALEPMMEQLAGVTPPPVGDVATRRSGLNAMLAHVNGQQKTPADVITTDHRVTGQDDNTTLLRWYDTSSRATDQSGPAVLYLHGGGMILGSVDIFDGPVARYVSRSGVPMLSVDYRLAPEHPHPAPIEDAYTALIWLAEHADELGVDPTRIAVMGDSAGGGLAAGLAILARDRGGPALCRQILLYPMLDDRNTVPDEHIVPFAGWTYDDNITGWSALLGDAVSAADVPPYAAPARLSDATDLPAAYHRGRTARHLPR